MTEVIYRFRIIGEPHWSYTNEQPRLAGIPHELQMFVFLAPIMKANVHEKEKQKNA